MRPSIHFGEDMENIELSNILHYSLKNIHLKFYFNANDKKYLVKICHDKSTLDVSNLDIVGV